MSILNESLATKISSFSISSETSDNDLLPQDGLSYVRGPTNPQLVFPMSGVDVVATSTGRMVLAYSSVLQQVTGWTVVTSEQSNGATMIIEFVSEEYLHLVTELGFFSLTQLVPDINSTTS